MKAIDPSEILVGDNGTVKSESARANPWNRFLARMVDYFLFILLLRGLRAWLHGPDPVGKWDHLIPFEYFLWIPVEAFLLWTLGTTFGKWFLHIQIRQGRRSRPDYLSALQRSFQVWFRGAGLFIPFLNIICMLVAYQRLKTFQITSWDRDTHFQVTHRFVPTWRIVIAAIMIGGLVFFHFHH